MSHQLLFLLQPHPEWWHAISCVCVAEEITAVSLSESLPLKTALYDWEEEVERCLLSEWLISGSLPNRIVPHIGKDTVRQRSRNNILTAKKFFLLASYKEININSKNAKYFQICVFKLKIQKIFPSFTTKTEKLADHSIYRHHHCFWIIKGKIFIYNHIHRRFHREDTQMLI